MKKILTLLALAAAVPALAQNTVPVSDVELNHEGDNMVVSMNVDLSALKPDGSITLVPVLYKGDTFENLRPVGVYSRGLFYHFAREARSDQPFAEGELKYLSSKAPASVPYVFALPYKDWMDGASLRVDTEKVGCCGKPGDSVTGEPLATFVDPIPELIKFTPKYLHVRPGAEAVVKERSVSGEAYVIFPSGKTVVDPKYRGNASELQKIRATIDSVAVDPDIQITGIVLRGNSSPEGKFASNEKLSQARTESIKSYVSGLYQMPDGVFKAEAVAENWDGLKEAVEASSYANKEKLLEIINSDLDPDKKEARLKSKYPKDWKKLVADIFPSLRRTDYKVGYTVRSYTTVDEIRQVMRTKPQNLSLNEFFLLSQGLEPGTPEFNEIFSIAAAVYPDDPVANINAANAAMGIGALDRAEQYLDHAGDSPKVVYTRGVAAALREDYAGASAIFAEAAKAGVSEAKAAKKLVDSIIAQRADLKAKGQLEKAIAKSKAR